MSKLANKIVNSILLDMSDRSGFGVLDMMDDDTLEEMKEEWMDIINREMEADFQIDP